MSAPAWVQRRPKCVQRAYGKPMTATGVVLQTVK
jgi:hypothetical protein